MQKMYQAEGKEIPELEFVFKYDVPSFLQYYAYAFTLAGLERITGSIKSNSGTISPGVRKPSEKTARKIEESIRCFAKDLEAVRFV